MRLLITNSESHLRIHFQFLSKHPPSVPSHYKLRPDCQIILLLIPIYNTLLHVEYCHVLVSRRGVWIGNCIYWTPVQVVTTVNSKCITDLHTLQITLLQHTVSTSRSLLGDFLSLCTRPHWMAAGSQLTHEVKSVSKSELLYDWRFTANQFVLAPSPLRFTTRDLFLQLNPSGHSPYVTSSLTRR
jgi:hypothetical protein